MSSPSSFTQVIWRFIKPEIEELAVYTVALICFTVSASIRAVSGTTNNDGYGAAAVLDVINESTQFITNGSDFVAKLFTFGAWFIIGTLLYALIWFLITFASGAFKDIDVSSHYLHPRTFNKSSYWFAIVSRLLVRISAAISLALYIAFWCAVLAPAWHGSFISVLVSGVDTNEIIDVVIASIGIALSLHAAAILLRLVLLRSRYIYHY